MDLATKLQQWQAGNSKAMALNDLVDLANVYATGGVAVLADVQVLLGRLLKVPLPEERPELVDAVQSLLVTTFRALIVEARVAMFWDLRCSHLFLVTVSSLVYDSI